MAHHIAVISTENTFVVHFNDYGGQDFPNIGIIPISHTYQKRNIEFSLESDRVLAILVSYSRQYPISFDGIAGTFRVATINSIEPTSNEDLYNKLKALLD
jgi:hypothetical protein